MAKNYVPTIHSKVRYSQRVNYRESMDKTVYNAIRLGVRLDDIPNEYDRLRGFMQRNKIYYKERIYIFAEQGSYKKLVTVYYSKSKILEEVFQQKEKLRREKYYKQMFTSQAEQLYSITLQKGRICGLRIVDEKKYSYQPVQDMKLWRKVSIHLGKLLRGKTSNYDIKLYLEDIDEFERNIYKRVLEIERGQTVTYKELANEFNITVQKLTGVLKRCAIPIFIPTHRVIKTNGQIGSHTVSKDLKIKILNNEREEIKKPIKKQKENVVVEEVENDFLCYNISDLLKDFY